MGRLANSATTAAVAAMTVAGRALITSTLYFPAPGDLRANRTARVLDQHLR
jgi:hypothetical protein